MNVRELLSALPPTALVPAGWVLEQLTAAGNKGVDAGLASDAVFTVTTLAAALHRSPSTIRGWCERGELQARLVKGRWFIRAAAVNLLLDGPRAEETPSRTIRQGANARAGPRRARADGTPADLSAWRKLKR